MDELTKQLCILGIMIMTMIGVFFGMFYIYKEFKQINTDGKICLDNPFIYGGNLMIEKESKVVTERLKDSSILSCMRNDNGFFRTD